VPPIVPFEPAVASSRKVARSKVTEIVCGSVTSVKV